jgi:hypothetical protein
VDRTAELVFIPVDCLKGKVLFLAALSIHKNIRSFKMWVFRKLYIHCNLEAVDIMCKWKVQLKINLYHFRLSTGINTRSPVLFACSRNVIHVHYQYSVTL